MSNSLRILAWPAFKAKGSPYNALLYNNMQTLGATVEEFTAWRVLSTRYDVVHLHRPSAAFGEPSRHSWTVISA